MCLLCEKNYEYEMGEFKTKEHEGKNGNQVSKIGSSWLVFKHKQNKG